MAVETQLQISEQEVIPSRAVESKASYISNASLLQLQQMIADLEYYCLKCASNNSPNVVKPEDLRQIKEHLLAYKQKREYWQKYNDQPTGSLEYEFAVVFPTAEEVQALYNKRLIPFVHQIRALRQIMQNSSSAGLDNHVDEGTWADVLKGEAAVADAVVVFLESKVGPADLKAAGRIVVDRNFKFERLKEQSPDLPKQGYGEAGSVPSSSAGDPSGGQPGAL